jgi:hypothetical protein
MPIHQGGEFDVNGYKRDRGKNNQAMKFLETHKLVNAFIKKYIDATRIKGSFLGKIIGSLIAGKILLPRSSPNKIQHDLVTGDAKATFYRDIHRLACLRW